jgi:hypothetical protein
VKHGPPPLVKHSKEPSSRLPVAIATNLLFTSLSFLLPNAPPRQQYHILHCLPEVRRLSPTEPRLSTRAHMAQPDISSILAALGKCAHAPNAMRIARLIHSYSSAEPGCDPEQCDTATCPSESATACSLPGRTICASRCPSLGRIPSPAHQQWQFRSSWHQADWQWCSQHCRGNCQGKEHCCQQGCAVLRS